MRYFPRLCAAWSRLVFGEDYARIDTPMIRAMRLLEEATELAQAEGVGELEATLIVKKVYSKPIGDPVKEFGGVMITAAIYAHCRGLDMEESFMKEYERIMNVKIMNRVRQRNLSGDKPGLD